MKLTFIYLGCLLAFSLTCKVSNAFQNANDRLIYSTASTPIKIDGDLSEWEGVGEWMPILNRLGGDRNTSDSDFKATFNVTHDPNTQSLYYAIKITDDDLRWHGEDEGDALLFIINEQYKRGGSGVLEFRMEDEQLKVFGVENSWDPEIGKYANPEKLDYSFHAVDNELFLEFSFQLNEPIKEYRILDFDFIYSDEDSDSWTEIAFTRRGAKTRSAQPFRLATLVMTSEPVQFGRLKLSASWDDPSIEMQIFGLLLESETVPDFWMHVPLDRNSNLDIDIPEGDYRIRAGNATFFSGMTYYKGDVSKYELVKIIAGETNDLGVFTMQQVKKPEFKQGGNHIIDWKQNSPTIIDATIQSYMDYYEIEGVQFAIFKEGKISYQKSYGFKNNYTKEPVANETLFEVASITKPIVAYAALKMIERGVIDMDTPLHTYLNYPRIDDQPFSKLITARHVLSHQTGLPNWPRNGELKFEFKPGNGYSYSGSAYEYLGRVLEAQTGKTINQILIEEVVNPLEIDHFYFQEHPYAWQKKTYGHYNGYPEQLELPEKPWVAGSLVTNPESLAKFAFAILDRKGLSKEYFDEYLSKQNEVPQTARENNWDYNEYLTLGWFIEEAPYGRVLRHSGNNGDFKSILKIYEDLDAGYILIANGNTGSFIIDDIEKILISPN